LGLWKEKALNVRPYSSYQAPRQKTGEASSLVRKFNSKSTLILNQLSKAGALEREGFKCIVSGRKS